MQASQQTLRIGPNLETHPSSPNCERFARNQLDSLAGLLPVDPTRGFLPPNVAQPKGEGSVLFTIQPQTGLVDGTLVARDVITISILYSGVSGQPHSVAHDAMGTARDAAATPDAINTVNTYTLNTEPADSRSGVTLTGAKQFFRVHVQ